MKEVIYKVEMSNLNYGMNIVDKTMEYVTEMREDLREVLKGIFVLNPEKRMFPSELIKLNFFLD